METPDYCRPHRRPEVGRDIIISVASPLGPSIVKMAMSSSSTRYGGRYDDQNGAAMILNAAFMADEFAAICSNHLVSTVGLVRFLFVYLAVQVEAVILMDEDAWRQCAW